LTGIMHMGISGINTFSRKATFSSSYLFSCFSL
jgi:hypothetical protein